MIVADGVAASGRVAYLGSGLAARQAGGWAGTYSTFTPVGQGGWPSGVVSEKSGSSGLALTPVCVKSPIIAQHAYTPNLWPHP